MLSFFRKNTITDGEMAKISRQYTNLNEEIQIAEDASTLLDLGYSSPTELKETIYGELNYSIIPFLLSSLQIALFFQIICAQFEIPKNPKPSKI